MKDHRDFDSYLIFPCVVNGYTCHNEVGVTGTVCSAHDTVKCESCSTDFTDNHTKTECIGTCVNKYLTYKTIPTPVIYQVIQEQSRLAGTITVLVELYSSCFSPVLLSL